MLTHYEAVKSERDSMELFLKTRNVGVILDESTKIKNPNSQLTKVFLGLRHLFTRRVIMSGTPVSNRPEDIWAQIKFLDDGLSLGDDFPAFKNATRLSKGLAENEERQEALMEQLQSIFQSISWFSVRETKQTAEINLPDKIIHPVTIDWEPAQLDIYRQIRESLSAVVLKDGELTSDDSETVLKRLLRLVQATSNPRLIDSNYQADPGKLEALLDIVGAIAQKDEKCIVWTSFVEKHRLVGKHTKQIPATMCSRRT